MKKKTIVGALGVVYHQGKFLMGLRHQPQTPAVHHKWEFPGGEVEWDERPKQTAIREVKEEVGVKVKIKTLLPYTIVQHRKTKHNHYKFVFLCYLCSLISGQPQPDKKEVDKVKWFKPDEIDPKKCLPFTQEVIQSVLLEIKLIRN